MWLQNYKILMKQPQNNDFFRNDNIKKIPQLSGEPELTAGTTPVGVDGFEPPTLCL